MAADGRIQHGDELQMSGRRITILGGGPSSAERRWDILKYCEGTEIWSLNNMYHAFSHIAEKCKRWYELHAWEYLKKWDAGVPDHFEHLAKMGVPVYTTEKLPAIKDQHQIDWSEVFSSLCGLNEGYSDTALKAQNYALGSPSYILAHALWEHDNGNEIEYIQSWGIDTSDERHKQQRQSWSYWCGQAMARGIQLGGSMCDFMREPEMDAGLNGLRERIGDAIEKKIQAAGSTDYVIVTQHTDEPEWCERAAALGMKCRELGIDFYAKNLGPVHDQDHAEAIISAHPFDAVREALDVFNKPVICIDCDDEIIKAPTLPENFNIGLFANPEKSVIGTDMQVCGFFAAAPTDAARKALDEFEPIAKGSCRHRALCAMAGALVGTGALTDITKNVRGCFKINPSKHREKVCYS